MKKSLFIILPLVLLFIPYLLTSFYHLSLNPSVWAAGDRAVVGLMGLMLAVVGVFLAWIANAPD